MSMITENTIAFRKDKMEHFEIVINEKNEEHWQGIGEVNVVYQKDIVVAVFDCNGYPELFDDEKFEYLILENRDEEGYFTQVRNEITGKVKDSGRRAKTLLKKYLPEEDYREVVKSIAYTF